MNCVVRNAGLFGLPLLQGSWLPNMAWTHSFKSFGALP